MRRLFSVIIILIALVLLAGLNTSDNNLILDAKKLDANNISTWFRNNGSFNYTPFSQISGFEYPRGSGKFARFASGLWIGAKVGNDTLVTQAEYGFEFLPGYTDNEGVPQGRNDPLYKIYKLHLGVSDNDRMSWPSVLLGNSDQGAPVFFDSLSNSWEPLDFGQQTLFYRMTDSYPESHVQYQTDPLKADVIRLDFSYGSQGPLADMVFSQFTVINRSTNVWENTYLTAWTDDDLGVATDDRVGCDSASNLGYTYNGAPVDPIYEIPPAVSFLMLRGALYYSGNSNDTVKTCRNKNKITLSGYRDLKMSVFNWYHGSADPENGNPYTAAEAYRFMSGDRKNGAPTINPIGGYRTRHMFTGDPVTGQGWVQQENDDQRFLMSTGPLNMNPGDTQVLVVAQVVGQGTTNLNSITRLRQLAIVAKKFYDNCFAVTPVPPHPAVSYYAPGNGKIYLSWNDISERTTIQNSITSGYYRFQGYNIYQIRAGTDGSSSDNRVLLKTYDIVDGVRDIYDTVFDEHYQEWVHRLVQRGSDNSVSRFIVIDKDNIMSQNFINGTPYYFSVTAFHHDSSAGFHSGTPKMIESPVWYDVIVVIPQRLYQGSQVYYNFGDTILTNRRDLGVVPIVTAPLSLIDAFYKSRFSSVNNLSWTLTRSYSNFTDTIFRNLTDFSGTQDTARLIDGFLLVHQVVADSGVVKDPDDPARFRYNIKTLQRGWSYLPPENQWITGVDTAAIKTIPFNTLFSGVQFESRSMGLSFPNGSNYRSARTRITANGTQFTPGMDAVLTGGPLRKVRILFGSPQKAYMYSPPVGLPADTNFMNLPYSGYVNVPFSVYAVDDLDSTQGTPRQLNCAFIDADRNDIWDPDTSKMGKFQIVYILASDYNESAQTMYTIRNPGLTGQQIGFTTMDIMYVWLPRVIVRDGVPMSYTNGDYLEIYPYIITRPDFVPGYPVGYSWNVRGTVTGDNLIAQTNNQMDNVKVFPNPYFGASRLETNPDERFIYFSNLPKACTIYIYTLAGYLIKKIKRDVSDPRNSLEKWNLRNQDNNLVASGLYIALVEAPGIGTKILKLAVFRGDRE